MQVDVKKITIEFSNGFSWVIGNKNFDFKLTDDELKLTARQKSIKQFITEPVQTRSKEIVYG